MLLNILLLAGVAGAAYWYGSQRTTAPGRRGPIVAPIPRPRPVPLEGAGDYASMWAAVPFGVSIAPAGLSVDAAHQIPPPMGPRLASIAPDCSIVAVGEGWWDAAGDAAQALMSAGVADRDIVELVLAQMLPAACSGAANTQAVLELRRELGRRLSGSRRNSWGVETTWIPPAPSAARSAWGAQRRVMRRRS